MESDYLENLLKELGSDSEVPHNALSDTRIICASSIVWQCALRMQSYCAG